MIGLPSINRRIISPHQLRGATINRNSPQAAGLVFAANPNVFPGGGTLYDRAGRGHDGTITGADWVADPEQGWVLDYSDLADEHVDLGSSIGETIETAGQFSVVAWAKCHDLARDNGIVSRWTSLSAEEQWVMWMDTGDGADGYAFGIQESFGVFRIVGTTDASANLDEWQCVIGVWDGSNIYIYVDGVQIDSVACSAMMNTANIVRIGDANQAGKETDASIAEVRIYSRALSAAEIMAIYQNPYDLWQPTLQIPLDDDYAGGILWHPGMSGGFDSRPGMTGGFAA